MAGGGRSKKKRAADKDRRELMAKLPTAGIVPDKPISCLGGDNSYSPQGLLLQFLRHNCFKCDSSFWFTGGLDDHIEAIHDEDIVCKWCKQVVDHSAAHTLKIPRMWRHYFLPDAEASPSGASASKLEVSEPDFNG